MHNLHVRTAAADANWTTAQKIDYCIWRIKSTSVGVLAIAKKGNILLEQTSQALVRLRRYLEMQSQLTTRAICSVFLDVGQQKHRWCHHSHDTKERYLQKRMRLLLRRIRAVWSEPVSFYIQGRYFYLSEQHGLWMDCILTEELTMRKMIPTDFVLTLPNIIGHSDRCTCIKSHDQSRLIPLM